MPDPPTLAQIRKSVAEHPEKFAALLTDPLLAGTFGTIDGERLKRPPQGYDESTPYVEYIKLKNWAAMVEPKGWLGRTEGLVGEIVETCRAAFPLVRWLREALSGSGEGEYLSPEDVDRLAESGL